uniref:Leucine-rich repeat domain-containing protein n=1 Tax=Prevotella sp. GTC17259 TaxID=3236795 RepID=A0AB33J7L8_9BACT
MKKLLFIIMAMLMAVSVQATVKVTSTNGIVTIAVEGGAGQIGTLIPQQWVAPILGYSQEIDAAERALIKSATHLVITGNINNTDIKVLFNENQVNNTWSIPTLDMGKAKIASLTDIMPNNYSHIAATSVVLPVAEDKKIPNSFGLIFDNSLKEVTIPEGYTSIGESAFYNKPALETVDLPTGLITIEKSAFKQTPIKAITLPNSLKSIDDEAFQQCPNLKTISFPEGFEKLGDHVFNLTQLLDVYFLGKTAPIVGKEAFNEGNYHGYGGMKDTDYSASLENKLGDTNNGYAERRNYTDGDRTMAVLHLRSDMTNDERAKYIDITRDYRVEKREDNKYAAFKDLYYGDMKIWPGQYSYEHTYNNAKAGTLWDEKTTYEADKYMGLHKFSITVSDINAPNTDTEKWQFSIKPDQWWTICVPFRMTKAQVRDVFGENTEVCKLNEVVRDYDKNRITLKFKDDQYQKASGDDAMVIQDHISYMIFPTKALASDAKYTFAGYHREVGYPEPTIVRATIKGTQTATEQSTVYNYRFIGCYLTYVDKNVNDGKGRPINMPKFSYFLGKSSDNKHKFFFQTGTTGKWNPYTATVQVFRENQREGINDEFIASAAGARSISYFGLEDEDPTTGIDEVAIEVGNGATRLVNVYNLNGQLVRQGSEDLNGLPAGVYVVNGKKIMVH